MDPHSPKDARWFQILQDNTLNDTRASALVDAASRDRYPRSRMKDPASEHPKGPPFRTSAEIMIPPKRYGQGFRK
jgi:hypothetical protein